MLGICCIIRTMKYEENDCERQTDKSEVKRDSERQKEGKRKEYNKKKRRTYSQTRREKEADCKRMTERD